MPIIIFIVGLITCYLLAMKHLKAQNDWGQDKDRKIEFNFNPNYGILTVCLSSLLLMVLLLFGYTPKNQRGNECEESLSEVRKELRLLKKSIRDISSSNL